MTNNKPKLLLGLLILAIFVAVFAVPEIGNKNNHGLDRLYSQIKARVSSIIHKTPYQNSSNYLNQQVVSEESSVVDVVSKVSPAVVSVIVKTVNFDMFTGPAATEQGIGTGFIINSDGLIVTNSHVVSDPNGQYSIVLKDGTTYEVKKVHLDTFSDIALLEIDAKNLPTVNLGDSDVLKVGQRAIAIGNALGMYQNTVTVGVVSGISREVTAYDELGGNSKTYENAIQTDAALNPGNSGGPLLNSAGQVIGINVATSPAAQNLSFAIPVNTLKPIIDSFLKVGRIVRPYLGVQYTIITKEIADIRRLPQGAFVSQVVTGSPADKGGIERGDIVKTIDGVQVSSANSLSTVINKHKVGDAVAIVLDRSGKEQTVYVTLEEAPEN
ncbi:MAG TPA: trypsin-like peptidase domain-containing protein [Candidatus Saccharimonadales bacterium]|nr:trypsin-like peptidase domain-containing protein [Candidatus Saccharimonadales bacterium]